MKYGLYKIRKEAPRTVIFCHHGVMFLPGDNINKSWDVLRNPPDGDLVKTKTHYEKEIIKCAKTRREFIFVWYDETIAEMFERLLHNPSRPEYGNWKFMAFFHQRKDIDADRKTKNRLNSWKRYILESMAKYDYIIKYSIPYGHLLTSDDIKAIDDFWEAPNHVEDIDEIKSRKPKFPILTYPVGGALAMKRNKRIQELLA
jgi:hypothetical protein